MRTVTGSTDHVVVVGAGLGGLACALHLAAAGRQVTIVERESVPGGRAGRLTMDGFDFDTGPTVLTMPGIIADVLAAEYDPSIYDMSEFAVDDLDPDDFLVVVCSTYGEGEMPDNAELFWEALSAPTATRWSATSRSAKSRQTSADGPRSGLRGGAGHQNATANAATAAASSQPATR